MSLQACLQFGGVTTKQQQRGSRWCEVGAASQPTGRIGAARLSGSNIELQPRQTLDAAGKPKVVFSDRDSTRLGHVRCGAAGASRCRQRERGESTTELLTFLYIVLALPPPLAALQLLSPMLRSLQCRCCCLSMRGQEGAECNGYIFA